jgi:serine/threonine protein kinase
MVIFIADFRIGPERYGENDKNRDKYKLDVFAFAMTAYQLLVSELPWPKVVDPAVITFKICKRERPAPVSASAKEMYSRVDDRVWELIGEGWHQDPEKRPNFGDIVKRLENILVMENIKIQCRNWYLESERIQTKAPVVQTEAPLVDSGTVQVFDRLASSASPSKGSNEREIANLCLTAQSKSNDRSALKYLVQPLVVPKILIPSVVPKILIPSRISRSMESTTHLQQKVTVLRGSRRVGGLSISMKVSVVNFGHFGQEFQGHLRHTNSEEKELVSGVLRDGWFSMITKSKSMEFKGKSVNGRNAVSGNWYAKGHSGVFELAW